ncbi:MAG: hypothetical protein WA793_04215 [Sphingorhabdus sp.]|uniref:hypothetical protein n=1 Tax=Sphingorhabdus sp. TaxID=1902408 RepID=UPI003C9BE66A
MPEYVGPAFIHPARNMFFRNACQSKFQQRRFAQQTGTAQNIPTARDRIVIFNAETGFDAAYKHLQNQPDRRLHRLAGRVLDARKQQLREIIAQHLRIYRRGGCCV